MCVDFILDRLKDHQQICIEADTLIKYLCHYRVGYRNSRGKFEDSLILNMFVDKYSKELKSFTKKFKREAQTKLRKHKKTCKVCKSC